MRFYIFADLQCYTSTFNWELIHAPENFPTDICGSPIEKSKEFAYNIKMEKEMNRAGSLTFTLGPDHPILKKRFIPLGVTIALTTPVGGVIPTGGVPDGVNAVIGHVIWYGRVLSIEKTFNNEVNVTCEGALAFLNDVMVRPRQFFYLQGYSDAGKAYNVPAVDVLDMIFGEYNTKMSSYPKRCFYDLNQRIPNEQIDETTTPITAGSSVNPVMVDGQEHYATTGYKVKYSSYYYIYNGSTWENSYKRSNYISETYYQSIDDYVSTLDKMTEIANIEPAVGLWAECVDDVDFKLRVFIHYLPSAYNPSHIVFANNLADFADNGDGLDIYTCIIPFGNNKLRLSNNAVSNVKPVGKAYEYWVPVGDVYGGGGEYGYIEKTIDFSECETGQELSQMAGYSYSAYTQRFGKSFNVSAVDLSILSEIQDEGYIPLIITDPDIGSSDFNPTNLITIGDGVNIKSNPHDLHYSLVAFTCTSVSLDIDNPGASNYTFEIYDSNYLPSKPKMLTEYYDRRRAIAEGKVAQDGTIYRAAQEATAVYKENDNSVYADYDGTHQEHYTANGTGDTRTDIQCETVAPNTYTPPNNS